MVLVDGLRADSDDDVTVFADAGFGEGCRSPLPLNGEAVVCPDREDTFTIVRTADRSLDSTQVIPVFPQANVPIVERFDSVLLRHRKAGKRSSLIVDMLGAPTVMEGPVTGLLWLLLGDLESTYFFNSTDDLAFDDAECCLGLGAVVVDDDPNNMFTQSRLCLKQTEKGYDFVGETYFKRMECGETLERFELTGPGHFRAVLKERFGMELEPVPRPARMLDAILAYEEGKAKCADAAQKSCGGVLF